MVQGGGDRIQYKIKQLLIRKREENLEVCEENLMEVPGNSSMMSNFKHYY